VVEDGKHWGPKFEDVNLPFKIRSMGVGKIRIKKNM